MSEIKFRGKSVNGKIWIYGCYAKNSYHELNGKEYIDCIEVIPKTVGQFTGKRDDKGNEIYKGHLVEWTSLNVEGKQIGEVTFLEGCWFIQGDRANSLLYDCLTIEIIGNIHENPELMEVQNATRD
jgi:uncharacterized phage protein (TIGR01671 family)